MILIGLLYTRFIENLTSSSKDFPPNHIIRVSKQEVLNIEVIDYEYDFIGVNLTNPSIIDLSNLSHLCKFGMFKIIYNPKSRNSILPILDLHGAEFTSRLESLEIKIEGLCSLETMFLGLHAAETYSFSVKGNLCSLKCFYLEMSNMINQDILTLFLDKFPNIEELNLLGNFSYFNFRVL